MMSSGGGGRQRERKYELGLAILLVECITFLSNGLGLGTQAPRPTPIMRKTRKLWLALLMKPTQACRKEKERPTAEKWT